ncbi:IS66 family insertion sequence element accessory protein TnpB, partial [Aurantimonas sp. C2-5-R2]|uniref:IS66 family insertion sequence element accessory protein TnpB n=1 Tax=Aurantimonas sp. C2-5-R2 TaxID=3113713 RepID=UPI002F921A67
MRKGFPGLSLMVQETLKRDPNDGHLFVFRGRRGDLIKVIWHDGQGACLFTKRLERGRRQHPIKYRRRSEDGAPSPQRGESAIQPGNQILLPL